MRRLGAAVACALGALAVLAPLAAAHTGGAGTDYASRIASTPPGIEARMIGGDDRIELRRTGDATYVVVGYVDEPFLKLAPDGIYENAASISVPLSADRLPDQATARALDARAPEAPRWRRISTGSTIAYHDHRAHWMSETPPAIVRAQPGTTRMLFDWSIPIEVDGVRDRIRGQVGYVAPPRATAWWVALALALAAAAALALRLAPARAARRPAAPSPWRSRSPSRRPPPGTSPGAPARSRPPARPPPSSRSPRSQPPARRAAPRPSPPRRSWPARSSPCCSRSATASRRASPTACCPRPCPRSPCGC